MLKRIVVITILFSAFYMLTRNSSRLEGGLKKLTDFFRETWLALVTK